MDSSCLHLVTPLLHSTPLSQLAGRDVFLKLENVQPGGSFKIRGIGKTMQAAVKEGGAQRFVGSSGGNAGMAMAVAARRLDKELTIYIPTSTKPFMVEKLKADGATVVVGGANWNEANQAALLAGEDSATFMVHPYNQATTWEGHSTLVDELVVQLKSQGVNSSPSGLVTCVGGGGLAMGLIQGLQKQTGEWSRVPIVTMETRGANCLAAARKAGEVVQLEAITSVATSLGALSVLEELLEYCQAKPDLVLSHEVSDATAIDACLRFSGDHRIMVEPACGAALSALYSGLAKTLLDSSKLKEGPLVVVVCGGNIVNLEMMQEWSNERKE